MMKYFDIKVVDAVHSPHKVYQKCQSFFFIVEIVHFKS